MGVAKTKRISLFSIPGSSWFIYTPTKKNKYIKIKNTQPKHSKISTKSPLSHHQTTKSQYRTQYRKPLLKSTLSPITQPKSKLTIQTNFFLYKYKNPKKIHIFTDYQLFIKNASKTHAYLQHKKRI